MFLANEVHDARTVRRDAREHPALSDGSVIDPATLQGSKNLVLGVPVRGEQRHPQIDSLLVVRLPSSTRCTPYGNAARTERRRPGRGGARTAPRCARRVPLGHLALNALAPVAVVIGAAVCLQ